MPPLRDWSVLDRDVLNLVGEDKPDRKLLLAPERGIRVAVDSVDGWFGDKLTNHAATARAVEEGDAGKAAMPCSRSLVSTAPSYLAARPAPAAGTAGQAVPAV